MDALGGDEGESEGVEECGRIGIIVHERLRAREAGVEGAIATWRGGWEGDELSSWTIVRYTTHWGIARSGRWWMAYLRCFSMPKGTGYETGRLR
jgi:hypothetical protein